MTEINWQWKQFEQLSVYELHDTLKLRQEVFVIEQNCIYPDIDKLDKTAWHLLGYMQEDLNAYLRLYLDSNDSGLVQIGRILTSQKNRGSGLGKRLMTEGLNFVADKYPQSKIKVSAQIQLEHFYNEFGFEKTSEPYDEDGILHVDMEKTN